MIPYIILAAVGVVAIALAIRATTEAEERYWRGYEDGYLDRVSDERKDARS